MTATKSKLRIRFEPIIAERSLYFVAGKLYLPKLLRVREPRGDRLLVVTFSLEEDGEAGDDWLARLRLDELWGLTQGDPIDAYPPRQPDAHLETRPVMLRLDEKTVTTSNGTRIRHGDSTHRFTFKSFLSDQRNRAEFKKFLGQVVAAEQLGRAHEVEMVEASFDQAAEVTEEEAVARDKAITFAQDLIQSGKREYADSRKPLRLYYAIGFLPFSVFLCMLARSMDFQYVRNHLIYVVGSSLLYASLYTAMLEYMKRCLSYAQRRHTVFRTHQLAAGMTMDAARRRKFRTAARMESHKKATQFALNLVTQGAQQPPSVLGESLEVADVMLAGMTTAQ